VQYVPFVTWRERLRAAVDASGRTQTAIAAAAGVNQETLSRVLSGIHVQPGFDTVVRITHALGENVGTLLDEPAFLLDAEQRAEVRRVVDYLHAAVRMSPALDALAAPNAVLQRTAEVSSSLRQRAPFVTRRSESSPVASPAQSSSNGSSSASAVSGSSVAMHATLRSRSMKRTTSSSRESQSDASAASRREAIYSPARFSGGYGSAHRFLRHTPADSAIAFCLRPLASIAARSR